MFLKLIPIFSSFLDYYTTEYQDWSQVRSEMLQVPVTKSWSGIDVTCQLKCGLKLVMDYICAIRLFTSPRPALLLIASIQPAWKHEVITEYSFSLSGLEFRLIPQHDCFLFYLYPFQTKKARTHLEFSENKTKGLGRGTWNLFRCQGQDYTLLGLETEGKEKSKTQNYNWGKTKAYITLCLLFHWRSLSESCFMTDYILWYSE